MAQPRKLDFDNMASTSERPAKWQRLGNSPMYALYGANAGNPPQVYRGFSYKRLGKLTQNKLNKKDNATVVNRYNMNDSHYMRSRIVSVPFTDNSGVDYDPAPKAGNIAYGAVSTGKQPIYEMPFMNQNDYSYFFTTTVAGNERQFAKATRCPMYIIGLTDCPNEVKTAADATVNTTNPHKDICYPVVTSSGDVTFRNAHIGNSNAAPTTAIWDNTLRAIDVNGDHTDHWTSQDHIGYLYPRGKAILRSSTIKMEFVGQEKRPTEFRAYICQFDESCAPTDGMVNEPFSTTTVTGVENSAIYRRPVYPSGSDGARWWKRWFKRIMFHPDHESAGVPTCGMNILYYKKYYVEPTKSTDYDDNAQMVADRLKLDWDRMCKFDYQAGRLGIDTPNNDGWIANRANNASNVDPKARIYLVITAGNYYEQSAQNVVGVNGYYDLAYIPGMNLDIKNVWTIGS